jgi:hypothetical protein
MFLDRRQFHRVSPDYPMSVFLGGHLHSRVFDFCEGGLAVFGLTARELGEVMPLRFDLPEGNGCIEGRAEIVWTNESEHRIGLHFLDLAESSREQLSKWISARACTATEKKGIRPFVLTLAIGIALATVLLSSALGFMRHYLRGMRSNLHIKDSKAAAKAPELPPEHEITSVNPSSATAIFSPPTSRLDLPGFVLQVGAMIHEENADALAQALHRRNYPAFVFKGGIDRFYRVAVGPYSDEDSPARVKSELERLGLKAFRRRWRPE